MTVIFAVKTLSLIVILSLALYHDIKEQKIKNAVTLPGAVFGFLLNIVEGGVNGSVFSLKGWIVPVLLLIVLYLINVMGAGDIKLFAAIGAIMGVRFAVGTIVFSIYIGGLIAIVLLLVRKRFLSRMSFLLNYLLSVFWTGRLALYCNRGDTDAKFIFSTAIVPGSLLQLLLSIVG